MSAKQVLHALALLKQYFRSTLPAGMRPQIVFHGAEPMLNRETAAAFKEAGLTLTEEQRAGIQVSAAHMRRDLADMEDDGVISRVRLNVPWEQLKITRSVGGNKLDAYLRARASYSLGKCGEFTDDGYFGRKALLSLEVASDAPKSNLPWYVNPPLYTPAGQKYVMGANRTLVSVYGPVGSTIRSATLDGQDVGNTQGIDNGHTVWVFYVPTKPGQKRLLKVEWAEPIVDDNGKNIQTPPVLISPVALNRIGAKSSSPGFCPIPAN